MTVARMALSQRQFPEAESRSEQALALAGTQLKRTAISATFTSGLAQVLSGSSAGRVKCQQAVATARQFGDPLLLSDALTMLAEAQLKGGDAAAALKSSVEAQGLAARVGSPDTELNACLAAARASGNLHDFQQARDYATRADKLLESLKQLWGSDNYNSFLKRPDIQIFRAELNQFLANNN